MAFEEFLDAKRVLGVLGKRFARYGLSLHPDKTRFVDFRSKEVRDDHRAVTRQVLCKRHAHVARLAIAVQ
jgi:RNA-directed DNA polymerase